MCIQHRVRRRLIAHGGRHVRWPRLAVFASALPTDVVVEDEVLSAIDDRDQQV